MNVQSITPVLLVIAPFALAFLLEAVVIWRFKIKPFWKSVGLSVFINLLTLCVLFGAGFLIGQLGYRFNGLRVPLQVFLLFWWLSVLVDGLLLQGLARQITTKRIYVSSLVMNAVSYLFLYLFVAYSH